MINTRRTPQSIDVRICANHRGAGRGAATIPADFLDLGSRQAVDLAIHRLVGKGTIRRLARGIYDYPKMHPVLGLLMPPPERIAKAIAGRQQARLQPAGAYAENLRGLGTGARQGGVPHGCPESNCSDRDDDDPTSPDHAAQYGDGRPGFRPGDPGPALYGQSPRYARPHRP